MSVLGVVFDLAGGATKAWRARGARGRRAAWRQCALSPLCPVRNFSERSGKFRSTRNGSGKIRVIPDDQFLAERTSFYLGLHIGPKMTEIVGDALNKIGNLPLFFFWILNKLTRFQN